MANAMKRRMICLLFWPINTHLAPMASLVLCHNLRYWPRLTHRSLLKKGKTTA